MKPYDVYEKPICRPGSDWWMIGTRVRKTKGSAWQGVVVGFYATSLTPEGYAVESEAHPGSVQIYPRQALEVVPDDALSKGAKAMSAHIGNQNLDADDVFFEADNHPRTCLGGGPFEYALLVTRTGGFEVWSSLSPGGKCIAGEGYLGPSKIEIGGRVAFERLETPDNS